MVILVLIVHRSVSIEHRRYWNIPVAYSICWSLCVCLCVQKVYCGKTAEWVQMPFGVMSVVGRGVGVLDGGGDRRRGRGSFGG